jgi:Ca2+-binding EF-hand superfamily protein
LLAPVLCCEFISEGNRSSPDHLTLDELRRFQQFTHFDHLEIEALFEQYKSLADQEEGISKTIFESALGPLGQEKNLITDRIFHFFDQNQNGFIDFSEMCHGMSTLCKGSLDEKVNASFNGYDLNGDGKISQEELHAMFKAYFQLSMELVRDVVKAMEEEMMESFEDDNNKPVSAVFTAPIPASAFQRSSTPPGSDSEGTTTPIAAESSNANPKKLVPANPSSSASMGSPKQAGHEINFPSGDESSPNTPQNGTFVLQSPTSPMNATHATLRNHWTRRSLGIPAPSRERLQPIMEQISQDAIAEMVQKTFESIDTVQTGFIDYEAFKSYVETDPTLISWFETLGSVF